VQLETLAPERFGLKPLPGLAGQAIYGFEAAQLVPLLQWLIQHEAIQIDTLHCITAVDEGPGTDSSAGTLSVHYHLKGLLTGTELHLKATLPRDGASIASLAHLFPTANWHEREAWDMMGVRFENHPDLRRILMPADWPGHPLRKDAVPPEQYYGIFIDHDKAREAVNNS
jgi:NADH-quinone oxidoreductase subunit C